MCLKQFAQGGIGPQIPSLDNQWVGEFGCEQVLERRGVELGPNRETHDALRREHRLRVHLDFEPRRIVGKVALAEPNVLRLAFGAAGKDLRKRVYALRDKAGVRSIDERRAAVGLRGLYEARDG